jgi:uncharacterized protein DUF1801
MRSIDSFYLQLREPNRSCLEALRTFILKHDVAISESLKYGMPFFCFNDKMLCYFWTDKKTKLPYIGFKEGTKLDFPWLDRGDRSRFSVMHIDPYEDLPLKNIRQTLNACIGLCNANAKGSKNASTASQG